MGNAIEVLARIESLFGALDPVLLVPLGIIALSLVELRRCVRDGWHRPEGWVPPALDRER